MHLDISSIWSEFFWEHFPLGFSFLLPTPLIPLHGLAPSIYFQTSMSGKVDLSVSRVTTVTICYAVPIPFMILFTGLRLFVVLRPSSKHPINFDDYLITLSTVRANVSFISLYFISFVVDIPVFLMLLLVVGNIGWVMHKWLGLWWVHIKRYLLNELLDLKLTYIELRFIQVHPMVLVDTKLLSLPMKSRVSCG